MCFSVSLLPQVFLAYDLMHKMMCAAVAAILQRHMLGVFVCLLILHVLWTLMILQKPCKLYEVNFFLLWSAAMALWSVIAGFIAEGIDSPSNWTATVIFLIGFLIVIAGGVVLWVTVFAIKPLYHDDGAAVAAAAADAKKNPDKKPQEAGKDEEKVPLKDPVANDSADVPSQVAQPATSPTSKKVIVKIDESAPRSPQAAAAEKPTDGYTLMTDDGGKK